jgi:hypothetical protein
MSIDLKNAKRLTGSIFPEAVYDASSGLQRVEEFLTPQMFKTRFLFGLPLISPITKEKISNEDLLDYITRAANLFESDAKVEVSPVAKRVRAPFDPNLYEKDIWVECPYKPIQKIIKMFLASASYVNTPQENEQYPSGAQIYVIPNEWIDPSYAVKGKVFVNPINPAFAAIGTGQAAASAGASILQFVGLMGWVPAFWTLEVVVGLCSEDGRVPALVNEGIGRKAAILLLTNLFPLYRFTSSGLGMDGMSQSVADMFANLIQAKIAQLEKEYLIIIKQIKVVCGVTGIVSNV